MIRRIVKMTFRPDTCTDFLNLFNDSKDRIRQFPGCQHLELWRNSDPDYIFMTYSWWESEADLEAYRQSELFRRTWTQTKALFAARPEAWSLHLENLVEPDKPNP
jgi:hypothetical protein